MRRRRRITALVVGLAAVLCTSGCPAASKDAATGQPASQGSTAASSKGAHQTAPHSIGPTSSSDVCSRDTIPTIDNVQEHLSAGSMTLTGTFCQDGELPVWAVMMVSNKDYEYYLQQASVVHGYKSTWKATVPDGNTMNVRLLDGKQCGLRLAGGKEKNGVYTDSLQVGSVCRLFPNPQPPYKPFG